MRPSHIVLWVDLPEVKEMKFMFRYTHSRENFGEKTLYIHIEVYIFRTRITNNNNHNNIPLNISIYIMMKIPLEDVLVSNFKV